MKIDELKFSATIPTQQYGNISPGVTLSDVPLKEGTEIGMAFISDLFAKYSEKGGLIPKEAITASAKKKSFNEEVEIGFDPIAHVYSYDGKQLTGATEYIKRFYKPFDVETISSVCESKWGVPQQIIKDIWEANGELTSDFGNVVHKALEQYHKYMEMGEVITSKKEGEEGNYVLPKHPILKAIVEGFLAIDKSKGKIVPEVLISDVKNGICGHADRILIIDEKKKICRIQDYKVNINSEEIDKSCKVLTPFDKLPANKLSKYQLQMSVYANMLQASGWSVEGLDVFVYEDTWKHFELPVLQVVS